LEKTIKKITISLFFILCLITTYACNSNTRQTFTSDFSSRLSGGGKVTMTFEVDFRNKTGIDEFKTKIEKIKYALTLTLSRKKGQELIAEGKKKTTNSLGSILKKYLNEKALAVRITNFKLQT
jgi:flagellar basal body-associated protein FliL